MKYKRFYILLLFPITYLLSFIASNNPSFSEWYSTVVYPNISIPINKLTSIVPFSIMEVLIILFILFVITYIIFYIRNFILYKHKRKEICLNIILNLSCIACITFFIFTLFCGINYHRLTFAEISNFTTSPCSKNELIELCEELTEQANLFRSQITYTSTTKLENFYETAVEANITYSKLGEDFPTLSKKYGLTKPVFLSKVMSYLDITGVFFPYTFEANVNIDHPAYLIPVTLLHELTHLQGYMREDEANFIAYIGSTRSTSAYFKYSGVMLAYIYATNALYSVDSNAHLALTNKLSQDVKNDLLFNNAYWDQFESKVSVVSNKINDSYLKINAQEDGVKSYGRMVDLLISEYRLRHNK